MMNPIATLKKIIQERLAPPTRRKGLSLSNKDLKILNLKLKMLSYCPSTRSLMITWNASLTSLDSSNAGNILLAFNS
jgi:hypothetical protein